jgi:hypothetical protein
MAMKSKYIMVLGRDLPREDDVRMHRPDNWCEIATVTIDMLPDLALLEIFHFYRQELWWTPVHVCQKWRNIVFGSPTPPGPATLLRSQEPVREALDVWPPLPISISAYNSEKLEDNIVAALEHNDRISEFLFSFFPSTKIQIVLASDDAKTILGPDTSGAFAAWHM